MRDEDGPLRGGGQRIVLEDTLKVATAEAYSGYKLYPWTHKQMNVRTPTDG